MVAALVVMLAAVVRRTWRRVAVAVGLVVGAGLAIDARGHGGEPVLPSYEEAFGPAFATTTDPSVEATAVAFREATRSS